MVSLPVLRRRFFLAAMGSMCRNSGLHSAMNGSVAC
jgi:hypothetical protein